MNLKTNIVSKIRSSTKWKLIFSLVVACSSVMLVYAGVEYTGTPYLGEGNPMSFIQTIEHEHLDRGSIGMRGFNYNSSEIVAYEVGITSPWGEKMKPTEWAKYTLYIPDSITTVEEGEQTAQVEYVNKLYPIVHASTDANCTDRGRLDFTIDGDTQKAYVWVETGGRDVYKTISSNSSNGNQYNNSHFSFDNGTYNSGDEIVLKVRSAGTCTVYLDRFEFRSPAPEAVHVGG